ncbi:MAG TPA: hypothetical protein PKV73_00940 [Agriterribacter sp.]|nr:hypothetical protein [Agriterribacter sp.]
MNTAQANIKAIKFDGYRIELTTNIKGKPVARFSKLMSNGKNKGHYKQLEGYYFGNEELRQAYVIRKIEEIKQQIKDKAERREKNKNAVTENPFKIGDILYQSWGYDQTNIDFFEVTDILPKSVKIRKIGQNTVPGSNGFMCENVTPSHGCYIGEEMTRPVKAWFWNSGDDKPNFSVSNGRHSLSLYTYGEKGLYQSHYA